ncbi:MAG TPA: VOC family protein [Thermoanaerobaculia bacterium]|nr:VOC family protein [Thermoanaerobaculia bacterium]
MRVLAIDHINIAGPSDLIARCRTFYTEILGLIDGHRPPFRSRGFWLYAGDQPVVHLTENDRNGAQSGPFNHFAFACEGIDDAIARLEAHAIPFERDDVPATRQTQLFLKDPAGISLELNFR